MKRIVLAASFHRVRALRLERVLSAWAERWCFLPQGRPLTLNCEEASVLATAERCLQTEEGDLRLVLESGSWRDAVFGAASDLLPDDALSLSLVSAAQDALLQDVCVSLGVDGRLTSACGSTVISAQCVALNISLSHSVVQLVIDAALLQQEKIDAESVSLSSRQDAISDAVVTLKVELPILQVALEDFFGLKVGDIICGQSPLDTPFRVMAGGVSLPVSAALGVQGLHKAIKLGT